MVYASGLQDELFWNVSKYFFKTTKIVIEVPKEMERYA